MTARAQRRMLNEVKKNPRVSARGLKKSLAHANISVDESTIRKTLNKNGVHGRTPRRKPLLSRKNIAALIIGLYLFANFLIKPKQPRDASRSSTNSSMIGRASKLGKGVGLLACRFSRQLRLKRWKNLVEAGRVVSPASPEELEGEHVPICLFYNQLARDKVVSQFKEK
ncbi:hypothetical protein JOQ06_005877 [Pogonophryne albipinna]|uniref:Transposase Tc1-like domain-containing protein n=1 Tax=Pogonophryne albipinna TaxID=1090488 RepID=A0AAD6FPT6_9TELE|nr:hypothetical protein JOQ06_005877 [Pogonophryne albipinna]